MVFLNKFNKKTLADVLLFKVFHFSGCLRPVFGKHFPFFVLPNP
jgi:hypothetical protein